MKTTITVKIWKRVLEKFDEKIEAACLRRDGYLARVIEAELPCLEQEIPVPNSDAVSKFIMSQLDLLDRKPISIKLPTSLAQKLDLVCAARRIPRDALVNRLLFLLATPNLAIDKVFFGSVDWRSELLRHFGADEYLRSGNFDVVFYPLISGINPFEEIRVGLSHYAEEESVEKSVHPVTQQAVGMVLDDGNWRLPRKFYTVVLDDKQFKEVNLYGLNCYLPEWVVPNHPDGIARAKRLDELLAL